MSVVVDLGVWEAEHTEALTGEPSVAPRIMLGVMVGTVGLNDQAIAQTNEVSNLAPDGNLAAEFELLQAAVTQEPPEQPLGGGLAPPQRAGEGWGRGHTHTSRTYDEQLQLDPFFLRRGIASTRCLFAFVTPPQSSSSVFMCSTASMKSALNSCTTWVAERTESSSPTP